MQLTLNLVSSVSIKRKKPWPKLSWIGQEPDGLYLLDGKRISQLYIPSGKTKKKISKLHGLMNDVCALNVSQNGQFLCGALYDGKIFLWDRDCDKVQFITGLPKVFNEADKGSSKNRIFLSGCGNMILLMVGFEKLFLWQKIEREESDDSHNIIGTWSQVHHGEYSLPNLCNKEATVDGVFYSDEVVGRCGAFSYVFNKGTALVITSLMVKSRDNMNMSGLAHNIRNQDEETTAREVVENVKYSIKWKSVSRPLYGITPATRLVKGRFVYVCRYSPDGQMLAIVLNQKLAKNTRLLFCSTLHSTSCIVDMKCCGGSDLSSGRTWWVSDIAWTTDSLLLIGITRSGALFITTKLGEPIKLITTGYGMNLGPSLFLSLHPRITVKSFQENIPPDNSEISSGSEKDIFHQKFSVAVHSSQPLLLCSDGYMVSVFHFNSNFDHRKLVSDLTKDISILLSNDSASQELEQTSGNVSVRDVSAVSSFIEKMGKNMGEYSSPGSTLSETATGFGIARDTEAGIISFCETVDNKNNTLKFEEMNEQQRMSKAQRIFLQALGIGTSCGRHWSQSMTVVMNLLIHTWAKLFTILLTVESDCELSNNYALFHNVITFIQSCLEAFRWDIIYQHCLLWFIQFINSTVKCLVSSKNFGSREIIDVCMKVLRMAEVFLHEIYSWSAVSNYTAVHYLGDGFAPTCDTHVSPKESTLNFGEHLNGSTRYSELDYKFDQSWLTLYQYACKMYKTSRKSGKEENHVFELLETLCWIQRKLQTMSTSRSLIAGNKTESLSDQGYKLYLDGKFSEAVHVLEKSFHESGKDICATDTKGYSTSKRLELSFPSTSQSLRLGVSLIHDELSSQLSSNIDTLLSILYIHLENYDLKAALTLVYSFIDTTHDVSLQNLLATTHEQSRTLIPVDDSELKITSSSSLKMLQLSILVKYPLAWVIDNRAMLVVQQLSRFMACYFTNLPLVIPTPFQGNISKTHTNAVKNLSQPRLTEVIGQQKLENIWTADHTMELLLISGLIGEAAWFANCLGDWKIAFLLSVSEEFRKKNERYVEKWSCDRGAMIIEVPKPEQLMKERINTLLHLDDNIPETDVERTRNILDNEHICSLHNLFEASVIAGLNLVPCIMKQLVIMLKESISKLDWIVPQDVYLPAPPLYCPQPARNDGDVLSEETRKEISLRTEVAVIVQKTMAVYASSNCFLYSAQQYCKHVVNIINDGRQAVPNIINELITTEGINIDEHDDEGSGVLRHFQEFCCLMWLLDVRNELAIASRKFSKLKKNLTMIPNDQEKQEIMNQCKDVLMWLQRLLPFSDFLNATDDVLDGIVTMLSELPLNDETIDLLSRHFHSPTPSFAVSTTDKLNRITRRIRNQSKGLTNDKSLRFQELCDKYRKEEGNIATKSLENTFLEIIPDFCKTLGYQRDFAFLRFLDTFLLITLAKNITSEDYKNLPLIAPYKNKPTLEMEMSSVETATKRRGKVSRKTAFGIQRSQSFQDVGDIRKKPENTLFSPDEFDSEKQKQVSRSNSLTDLRKVKPSTFNEELQDFFPVLLWLKRWCLIEEYQKGNLGSNKSYSFLNSTSTPTAIRIQLPLKLLVNTLWLLQNYYKDYAEAKGVCLRDKRSRKKKKRSKKEMLSTSMGEDAVDEEMKQDQECPPTAGINEENKIVDVVTAEVLPSFKRRTKSDDLAVEESEKSSDIGESVEKSESLGLKRKTNEHTQLREEHQDIGKTEVVTSKPGEYLQEKPRRSRRSKSSNRKAGKKLEQENLKIVEEGGNEIERKLEKGQLPIITRSVEGSETTQILLTKQQEGETRDRHVNDLQSLDQMEKDSENRAICSGRMNGSERSVNASSQHFKRRGSLLNVAPVLSQTDEGEVWDQTSVENISSRSGIRKKLFSSPASSSVEDKWKSLESFDADIPLFSFTHVNSDKDGCLDKANIGNQMMYESNVHEAGIASVYSRDDDTSLSSESLSVGQIRSDVATQLKVAAAVNSNTSVSSDRNIRGTSRRNTTKRKTYDETSSCDSLNEPQVKPIDEGSLLRRIIRSEMRKFIKAQQAEIRSQSSTVHTTDENLTAAVSKNEVLTTKHRKSQVKRKSGQEPPLSHRKYGDKGKNVKDQSSELLSDSPPVPKPSQVLSDQNSRKEDDVLNSYRKSDYHRSLRDATTTTENLTQNPSQVVPPFSQFPSVSGWPLWYNPIFPTRPPPWLWQNSANKENTDKETQVEDVEGANDHTIETNSSLPKKPLATKTTATNTDEGHRENISQIVSVAIQTENSEKAETSVKRDLAHLKSPDEMNDQPFLLSIKDQVDDRNENTGGERMSEKPNEKPSHYDNHTSNKQEFSQRDDVFPKSLLNEDGRNAPVEEPFTIPLLTFPTDVNSPSLQPLPFTIAWPEHTEVETNEDKELPLLQLNDNNEERGAEYFPPLPLTRHFENDPLLTFSYENADSNIRDFHLIQVPQSDDCPFPLLYFPETGIEIPKFYSEFHHGRDTRNDKPEINQEQSEIFLDKNFVGNAVQTSKARMKRRNQLAETTSETAIKPSQPKQPISKQTLSQNPTERAGHRITVQPAERHTSGENTSQPRSNKRRKAKPRRDKLKELNNIIRDLQRDINDDDDLILSEVSSLLSPEIRYENFERKHGVRKHDERENKNASKLPKASRNEDKEKKSHDDYNDGVGRTSNMAPHLYESQVSGRGIRAKAPSHEMKERHVDHEDNSDQKPVPVPRLYKPSVVSARDIHTEVPSHVPEQSIPVDAKVGTDNILRFPISVQTDTEEQTENALNNHLSSSQPVKLREPSVQIIQQSVETKELSVQTETEIKNVPARSIMRDAAINTDNVIEKGEDANESGLSLYPRVPADVYLDIQDIHPRPTEARLPSSRKDSASENIEQGHGAKFLSVVAIAEEDVKRQLKNKTVTEDKNYHKNEGISFEKGEKSDSMSAEEIMPENVHNGDHTTVAVFFSTDFQRENMLKQRPPSGNSIRQTHKQSKEKLSQRLHEMNEQFDAIEELTNNMEQDIQQSNRLLRTIENLNKITDQKSEMKKAKKSFVSKVSTKDQENMEDITRPSHEMSQEKETEYNVLSEKKASVLKTRPWINKPIEELIGDQPDGHTERSLDSLENSEDKNRTGNDGERMSDTSAQNRPDNEISLTSYVADTGDARDTEGYKDAKEDVHSRKSSMSTGTTNSHGDSTNFVETKRSDGRFKLSLTPEDVLNISREKLKQCLAGTTTVNVPNTRRRDKTPQKQQELREWMTKKRKLRHKEWTEKVNEKREAEFKPFHSKIQGQQTAMSSKKLKKSEKEREDNRRTQKKEHVDERLQSAYDLMNEMVTEHAPSRPALFTKNSVRNSQRKAAKKTSGVKANNRYKDNRVKNKRKKGTGQSSVKPVIQLYSRPISGQTGLTGFSSLLSSGPEGKESGDAPLYDYDIEESARQFITRKSYEKYQQKMSTSFDFERSISFRTESPFRRLVDPRVDELLEDVSVGDSLDIQRLDHLDSLLSGDSELRDLLSDVVIDKPSHDLLETRDDVISRNSRIPRNLEYKGRGSTPIENKKAMLDTFKVDRKENKRMDSYEIHPQDIFLGNEDELLEMSDEVAALLAEAKAAVGDDFSGTSEVEDIDWNEVDEVLQEQT